MINDMARRGATIQGDGRQERADTFDSLGAGERVASFRVTLLYDRRKQ